MSGAATMLPPPPHPRSNLLQFHLAQTGDGIWECSWRTLNDKVAADGKREFTQCKELTFEQVEAIWFKLTAE